MSMKKSAYMSPEAVTVTLEKCICLDTSIDLEESGNTEPIDEDILDW